MVTDNFNRDNGSLGDSWTPAEVTPGPYPLGVIQSNTAHVVNNSASQIWNEYPFGPNQEVGITVVNDPIDASAGYYLLLRATDYDVPGAMMGYQVEIYFSNFLYISRIVDGVQTFVVLDVPVASITEGQEFVARVVGDTITVYYDDTLIYTYVDPHPLNSAGPSYTGFGMYDTVDSLLALDDFRATGAPVPETSSRGDTMAYAYQVTTASTKLYDADQSDVEVTIQNLGPNAIYIDFGEAATTAGSLQIPVDGAYTTKGLQDIYAITTVLQVTPADTRVSVERVR